MIEDKEMLSSMRSQHDIIIQASKIIFRNGIDLYSPIVISRKFISDRLFVCFGIVTKSCVILQEKHSKGRSRCIFL